MARSRALILSKNLWLEPMKIKDLGEFGLIHRIARFLPSRAPGVVVGIGDDVAVLDTGGEEYLLATCDIQVEGVHFVSRAISASQLGRRVAAINVSDIAAMGGYPSWALVSLALTPETDVVFVDGLYEGMREQLGEAGAVVVGGNLSKIATGTVIDMCLLGAVDPTRLVLRNGARENDLILVTGTLGDSRGGLELLMAPAYEVSESCRRLLLEKHLTPRPRLGEGQSLGKCGRVHAMADVSDGLLSDVRHICGASRLGAEIWVNELPVSTACREAARACGADAFSWAMTGGEDYELVFTVDPRDAPQVRKILEAETGTECTVVGRMLRREQGIHAVFPDGTRVEWSTEAAGWDHFAF